jgi:hypothetical protein
MNKKYQHKLTDNNYLVKKTRVENHVRTSRVVYPIKYEEMSSSSFPFIDLYSFIVHKSIGNGQ